MSALTSRPEAAQGNLTKLLDTVIMPNGMYGEGVTNNAPVRERHSSAIFILKLIHFTKTGSGQA